MLTTMTATATPRRKRGHGSPAAGTKRPTPTAAERRLVLALCAARKQRDRERDDIARLAAHADAARLGGLLDHLRLTGVAGGRLLELGVDVDAGLEQEIRDWMARVRELGRTHELTTLALLEALERGGIPALALKGSVLARELYGDVGVRAAGDIDILVAAGDLTGAVEVVARMGWIHQAASARAASLPVLHETLTHPSLPRVELHWRVHWYETRFATDALHRAQRSGPHEPLVMTPADGLAALTLFYARDGFAGLRMPADAAAWSDARGEGLDLDQAIADTAGRYPELAAALLVGTELLGALVGLPTDRRADAYRLRMAAELATPFEEVTAAEARAKVGMVDLLLAPPRGARAALRRERQKIPAGLERRLTRHDGLPAYRARTEHVLRLARRWALAATPAAARARRDLNGAGVAVAKRAAA
jgi:hypothetical protein